MKLLHVALVSVLLCLPAQAQEIEYGRGSHLRYAAAGRAACQPLGWRRGCGLAGGDAEEHDTNACAIMTVAFVRGPALATVRNKDRTFQMVRILVVGVDTPEDSNRSSLPLTSRCSKSTSMRCSPGIHRLIQ